MPTTSTLAIPYPDQSSAVDVAADLAALAGGVETALGTDTGWVTLTVSAGFSAVAGYTPQIRRRGAQVWVRGMVRYDSGNAYAPCLSIPAGYRPGATTLLGVTAASDSKLPQMVVDTAGAYGVSQYYSGSYPGLGANIPVIGSWLVN